MASISMTAMPSQFQHIRNSSWVSVGKCCNSIGASHPNATSISLSTSESNLSKRIIFPSNLKRILMPISAVGSGLKASVTDSKDNKIAIKNAKVVIESQDEDKIQLRVDLPGTETQIVFDKVLHNLARTAPPIPGFRRDKGGKTTKVPKSFLLQILGEDRVTKFVIQEIVSSTIVDYVNKENLNVKDNKTVTTQTEKELEEVFRPGNEFGFNAELELVKPETESSSSAVEDV